ncbi:MAG: PD-(D/E)XK nuclease family protein, partial [Acidimicrobiia bacterium]|nr:PD-(D/E)XK nuclease family protein [Acidimicrobiia bacterium]
ALDFLLERYEHHYHVLFTDRSRFREGKEMLEKWLSTQDWDGFEVIETEVRHEEMIPTSIGDIPFVYIFDRLDRRNDGSIRVVDYKSWIRPIQAEQIHDSIQFRMYAAMAYRMYPDAPRIWVVADQLRYDPVGATFSPTECEEIYAELVDLLEEIIATEEPAETLNEDCRYCVRKHQCDTLWLHSRFDGPLALDDPPALAAQRYQVDSAIKALRGILGDIDDALIAHAEEEGVTGFVGNDGVAVKLSIRRKNIADPLLVARALGEHGQTFADRYGEMSGPNVLKARKDLANPIPVDVMKNVVDTLRTEYSNPYVTTRKATR